jgi:flagellar biosynthesis protein FlhA
VPRIPLIVAVVLFALLLLPGMPKWPILLIVAVAMFAWSRVRHSATEPGEDEGIVDDMQATANAPAPSLEVRLGGDLAAAWKKEEALIMDRLAGLRRVFEKDFGIGFPAVRLSEGEGLGALEYEIRVFGSRFGVGEIYPERTLALNPGEDNPVELDGIAALDPAFGLPAHWIDNAAVEEVRRAGVKLVDPVTVLITHFSEIVRGEIATLLTRSAVVKMLEEVRGRQPGLLEEIIPNVLSVSDIQRVLQNLLSEGVAIGNLDLILEHLADLARTQKDPGELTEQLRQRLSYAICPQPRSEDRESDRDQCRAAGRQRRADRRAAPRRPADPQAVIARRADAPRRPIAGAALRRRGAAAPEGVYAANDSRPVGVVRQRNTDADQPALVRHRAGRDMMLGFRPGGGEVTRVP